jgi:hypothetical protein
MKKIFVVLLLFLGLWSDCTKTVAGTEIETQTGKPTAGLYGYLISDEDKRPVSRANVWLYVADTAKSSLSGAVDSTISDSSGRYLFDSVAAGSYNLEARTIVADDTLRAIHLNIVHDSLTYVGVDTMYKPGAIQGLVTFDQPNKMGVIAYIPGTSYAAYTDQSGTFVISNVPAGTGYKIAYERFGYITGLDSGVEVKPGRTTVVPTKTLYRQAAAAPLYPVGVRAIYDSVSGVITVTWSPVANDSVAGYVVYRKNALLSASDPVKISGDMLVIDTLYRDTIRFTDTATLVYQYQVKTQNAKNERSEFSDPFNVTVRMPNKPALPSPADGAINQPVSLSLSWTPVKSPAGGQMRYSVFLDTTMYPITLISYSIDSIRTNVSGLLHGATYRWYVVAYDGTDAVIGPVWSFKTQP